MLKKLKKLERSFEPIDGRVSRVEGRLGSPYWPSSHREPFAGSGSSAMDGCSEEEVEAGRVNSEDSDSAPGLVSEGSTDEEEIFRLKKVADHIKATDETWGYGGFEYYCRKILEEPESSSSTNSTSDCLDSSLNTESSAEFERRYIRPPNPWDTVVNVGLSLEEIESMQKAKALLEETQDVPSTSVTVNHGRVGRKKTQRVKRPLDSRREKRVWRGEKRERGQRRARGSTAGGRARNAEETHRILNDRPRLDRFEETNTSVLVIAFLMITIFAGLLMHVITVSCKKVPEPLLDEDDYDRLGMGGLRRGSNS